MSKHYTADEARSLLDSIPPAPYGRDGFHDVTDKSGKLIAYIDDAEGHWVAIDPVIVAAINTPRLAETVIAQAEQIRRMRHALFVASDLPTLIERGIITAVDMEEQ